MRMRKHRISRAQLRQGSQGDWGGNGDEHFPDLLGSGSLTVYLAPGRKTAGLPQLTALAAEHGCVAAIVEHDPNLPGDGYRALRFTKADALLPEEVLRSVHRWAHRRNFVHSFFKPFRSR